MEMSKYTTVMHDEGKLTGSFSDALKGKTLYFDTKLGNQALEEISKSGVKMLTGNVVSTNTEQASMSVLYYKNFNKKVFSLPELNDRIASLITNICKLLIANIPDSTLYVWSDEYARDQNISYPASSEVERFLSEMAYLLHAYKDIDYTQSVITEYSALTRSIFSRVYEQLERESASKSFNITPDFYMELERITGLKSSTSSIKGVVNITSLVYHILKNEQDSKLTDFLRYIRSNKNVKIASRKRPIASQKGARINLLHEWNVVNSNSEMESLLGSDWPDLMKRQRKLLTEFRNGKDNIEKQKELNMEIEKKANASSRQVVYARQAQLHSLNKTRREDALKNLKRGEKIPTIMPSKSEWRELCVKRQDNRSLNELIIPLCQANIIESEDHARSLTMKGKIDTSIQSLVWKDSVLHAEPIYSFLLDIAESHESAVQKEAAKRIIVAFAARTFMST
jgi:hypothetical protein